MYRHITKKPRYFFTKILHEGCYISTLFSYISALNFNSCQIIVNCFGIIFFGDCSLFPFNQK